MKTIRADRFVLLQEVINDYNTQLMAGNLTQSSVATIVLAYDLDISPRRVTQTSVI